MKFFTCLLQGLRNLENIHEEMEFPINLKKFVMSGIAGIWRGDVSDYDAQIINCNLFSKAWEDGEMIKNR